MHRILQLVRSWNNCKKVVEFLWHFFLVNFWLQKKYRAFDRELLSAYQVVKDFRHYIEAKPFTLDTDHKPLTYALASTAERSPRQARHLSFIAEFTSDIQYIRGKHNVVADALSRIHAATIDFIDFHQLAKDQSL